MLLYHSLSDTQITQISSLTTLLTCSAAMQHLFKGNVWKLNKGQNMQHVQKKSETNLECNELSLRRSQSAASSSRKEMALFSFLA